MAARAQNEKLTFQEVGKTVRSKTAKGGRQFVPGIATDGIRLAVRDIPGKRAAGPGQTPAEFDERCTVLYAAIEGLFAQMIENGVIEKKIRRFFVAPSDKADREPALRSNQVPRR